MAINGEGIKLIKDSEGLRLKAYPDPGTGGEPITIGAGTTIYPNGQKVKKGDVITQEQALDYLAHDLLKFEKGVDLLVKPSLNDNQLAALVSFTYNVGLEAFKNSTMLKLLNENKFTEAANQFERWNKAGGKVLAGLTERRKKERALFLKPSTTNINTTLSSTIDTSKKLKILEDTFLKKEAVQSSELPNSKKKFIKAGSQLDYLATVKEGNHYLVTLANSIVAEDEVSKFNTWYIFNNALDLDLDGVPESKETLTPAEKIIDYMKSKNYKVFTGENQSNIVCLEAINPNFKLNNNTPNVFNDLRLIIQFRNGRPVIVSNEVATVSPGKYYTYNPMNPNGAAYVIYGQHTVWRMGFHNYKKDHPALVQVSSIKVTRDKNKDFSRTGDKEYVGLFGINLHHSFGQPVNNIGKASAGCIVGQNISNHFKFIEILKQDPRYKSNKNFIYTAAVIKGNEIF